MVEYNTICIQSLGCDCQSLMVLPTEIQASGVVYIRRPYKMNSTDVSFRISYSTTITSWLGGFFILQWCRYLGSLFSLNRRQLIWKLPSPPCKMIQTLNTFTLVVFVYNTKLWNIQLELGVRVNLWYWFFIYRTNPNNSVSLPCTLRQL